MGVEQASFGLSVRLFTLSNMDISDQRADSNQILSEASMGRYKGCIRFWDKLNQNSGVHGNR